MKKKIKSISGITLIEMLIGIIISTIMMGAMFTSYSVVNSTYRQVADRAKISQAGRDIVGMIVRDIRMAGYKYFGDNIKTSVKHSPLIITKSTNFKTECDKIEIVFGDVKYDSTATPKYEYERYKVTYECKRSKIIDKDPKLATGTNLGPSTIDAFAIYKSKVKWNSLANDWWDPSLDGDVRTYESELIVDYIEDLIFNAVDEKGLIIDPPPTPTNANKDYLYKIKTVDIALNVRSTKKFFRKAKFRKFHALNDTKRDGTANNSNTKSKEDRYLRDTIVVTAYVRNLGLK